jgi:uncharacterized protein (DUF1800 family)
MAPTAALHTAIAAHRFGLGEATLDVVRGDAQGWLEAQIGPADAPLGADLINTRQALELVAAEREKRIQASQPGSGMSAEQLLAGHYREATIADARSRLATAAATQRPFAERLQLFWANHFTVSLAKGSARGLVGAFEREAIRPHIADSFEQLLVSATTHPAMLRYLDNWLSAGPHSRVVARLARRAAGGDEAPRLTGLNENLAREVLELHTLGAESARTAGTYTQADVTAFANVLTGWRVAPAGDLDQRFDPAWHEPGRKSLLGKTYPEGPDALRQVLHDLAQHPATARFIATKLARHFVADDPPPALVERLAEAYRRSDGALDAVYRELIRSPECWSAQPAKLRTPEEFVLATLRVLGPQARGFDRPDAAGLLGQRILAAPSPAGWSDRADDWLGPDAVWKRVEWATRVAERAGRRVDARALAGNSLGPMLSEATRRQIERAADGPQALALLLLAPEFQRR